LRACARLRPASIDAFATAVSTARAATAPQLGQGDGRALSLIGRILSKGPQSWQTYSYTGMMAPSVHIGGQRDVRAALHVSDRTSGAWHHIELEDVGRQP
jgi:hypothetical protein